jgi:hypothetical protein
MGKMILVKRCRRGFGRKMKPQELDNRQSDLALGILEMGRLKPRDRRFYVVRPDDPTFN